MGLKGIIQMFGAIAFNIALVVLLFGRIGGMGIIYFFMGLLLGSFIAAYLFRLQFSECRIAYEDNNFHVDKLKSYGILALVLSFLIITAIIKNPFIMGIITGFALCLYITRYCKDLIYSFSMHNSAFDDMLRRKFKWLK